MKMSHRWMTLVVVSDLHFSPVSARVRHVWDTFATILELGELDQTNRVMPKGSDHSLMLCNWGVTPTFKSSKICGASYIQDKAQEGFGLHHLLSR